MDSSRQFLRQSLGLIRRRKELAWFCMWCAGIGCLFLWDEIFLNAPAFDRVRAALFNTLVSGAGAVFLSLVLGWASGAAFFLLEQRRARYSFALLSLVANAIRSLPQVVLVLVGYVLLNQLILAEIIRSETAQLAWVTVTVSVAVFLEVSDTIRSRLEYFRSLEFIDAMLCCGISESRIIHREILWRNSREHLLHKLIALFGVAIFLQCSVDFIVSVGLSTNVSLSNVPLTLGSLLASVDSKQDILALSNLFSDPAYITEIVVRHLQGVSAAFCIVFTLVCFFMIANGYARSRRLNGP
ncbi:MAG TPA: hypothetical protein VMM57_12520 [Bacteroidota bacterium]|nr:hypothetical protein [Bacteroidota bacterium]